MPISEGDVLEYLSSATSSSGGAISGSTVTSNIKNNVWPDITASDRIAGGTLYRKTFWKNNNSTYPLTLPVMYAPVLPVNITLSLGLGINDADDDDAEQGNMTGFSIPAQCVLISDGSDTRTATIYGLNNSSPAVPTTENVVMNGASEVASVATYSKVYAVWMNTTDVARTVTVKQGAGGVTRGVIGPDKKSCWLWLASPSTKAGGIALPDLVPGSSYGLWRRLVWTAGVSAVRSNFISVTIEENG